MDNEFINIGRLPLMPLIDFCDELREYLTSDLGLKRRVSNFNKFVSVDYVDDDFTLSIGFNYPYFETVDGIERIRESSVTIKIAFYDSWYAPQNHLFMFAEQVEGFDKRMATAKKKAEEFIIKMKEMEEQKACKKKEDPSQSK